MKSKQQARQIAVVGGGIAGLMSAWYLAKAGCQVTLYEKNTCGSGTTQFAAGMLAPVSEIEFSELELLRARLFDVTHVIPTENHDIAAAA